MANAGQTYLADSHDPGKKFPLVSKIKGQHRKFSTT